MVVVLVSLVAAVACADDTGTGFFLKIKLLNSGADSDFEFLTLNPATTYQLWYDGVASVSCGQALSATLSGNVPTVGSSDIWTYYETTDANPTLASTWTAFDSLVGPVTATATSQNNSGSGAVGPLFTGIGWTGVGIGYDVTLAKTGTGTATASGQGTLTVTAAVPEPGTILAGFAILGPVGLVFRRRRF